MGKRGHGEGSIYQRSDGRWAASITLEGGNRRRKTFYGKTRKEVQEKLRVALNEQKQGTLATGPKQTVDAYLTHWLENVYKPSVRPTTYMQARSAVRHHIIPSLGRITLQGLTPERIQAFYSKMLDEGLSPRSVTHVHAVLHKALDNAVRWNLISRNVSSLVSLPRIQRFEIYVLTLEQARKLIETAKGHRVEPILVIALATGLRHGELLALRWEDVDLKQKVLYVRHTVTRVGTYGYVENEPKTKSGRRRITLPDFAVNAFQLQRTIQNDMREKRSEKWKEQGLVFANKNGNFINSATILDWFRAVLKKAGLPHIRFHDLRHSSATILLAMGVHPKIVQERLGHSKIAMTMDIYSHVLPTMQQEAADKMNDVFKEQ